MKFLVHSSIILSFALALAACGGPDNSPSKDLPELPSAPPVKHTDGGQVKANAAAQKAALDRLETMKKITEVLKPLRDPAAALEQEETLKGLFAEYNRLEKVADDEGISGRLLAGVTQAIAPNDWRDARTEYQQYVLLVRQLGEPQREMMNRVMGAATPKPAEDQESE